MGPINCCKKSGSIKLIKRFHMNTEQWSESWFYCNLGQAKSLHKHTWRTDIENDNKKCQKRNICHTPCTMPFKVNATTMQANKNAKVFICSHKSGEGSCSVLHTRKSKIEHDIFDVCARAYVMAWMQFQLLFFFFIRSAVRWLLQQELGIFTMFLLFRYEWIIIKATSACSATNEKFKKRMKPKTIVKII